MSTKVDELKDIRSIMTSNRKVSVIDESGILKDIGKIEKINLYIEKPESMIGISRVENIMLVGENEEDLYADQTMVDNAEFHSDEEVLLAVAEHYGVSKDIIKVIE